MNSFSNLNKKFKEDFQYEALHVTQETEENNLKALITKFRLTNKTFDQILNPNTE